MKKVIILVGLLIAIAHTTFAEQRGISMKFHRKIRPENNKDVNRAPMCLPIEVVYDSDTHKIEVIGNESLEAEVFLYNESGTIEDYSSILNTDFTVWTSGTYIILIQGDGWYAKGEVEI